jgi:hypothetical protein
VDAVIRILSAVTTYYIALAAAIFVLWPTATWPQQPPCAPYEDVSKALASEYGEAVMERGLSQAGVMVEWWGNSATGTWTILTITAAGVACIVQAGELFETLPVGAPA